MRLLLAVDSVHTAELVCGAVAARQWAAGTVARVLKVIDYAVEIPPDLARETGGQMRLIRPEMEKRAEQVTARAAEILRASGIETEEVLTSGDPRMVIVDAADEWRADLIYLRAHNYKDLTRWMLGSVAHEVLRRASCSVGILRATPGDVARLTQGGMKILLATDGSEYSEIAARAVSEREWRAGSEIKVVGVVEPFARQILRGRGAAGEDESTSDGAEGAAQKAVDDAVRIIGGAGLRVSSEVLTGSPKERIVERAKEWGADLIVVGSHGLRGLKRLLLGSVSEFVANHAHCSAWVIRKPAV